MSKTFKKLSCAPTKKKTRKSTCYTSKNLRKMKLLWNIRNPKNKIKTNNSAKIWTFFKNEFIHTCHNERCWLKRSFIINNLDVKKLDKKFAPNAPSIWYKAGNIKNTWLSDYDIKKVMSQYERAYKDFRFIGPSPINYDKIKNFRCVWPELCNFNLSHYLKENITKIGIIFNTDIDTGPGEHWICIFINIDKQFIFMFFNCGFLL